MPDFFELKTPTPDAEQEKLNQRVVELTRELSKAYWKYINGLYRRVLVRHLGADIEAFLGQAEAACGSGRDADIWEWGLAVKARMDEAGLEILDVDELPFRELQIKRRGVLVERLFLPPIWDFMHGARSIEPS